MNESLCDCILTLANKVKHAINCDDVTNWVWGHQPAETKAQQAVAQQALDDLERRGLIRRIPTPQPRLGPRNPPWYVLVHRHQEVER